MPTLLTKPFDALNAEDVTGILGWPESLTVEYKADLPGKEGARDPWHDGKPFSNFARDKLFKEIIALANSAGGHVVLGVAETKGGTPPTAETVTPLPRCADLAERLSRAAQSIDPPIPMLLIRGIPTDGEAGVVVFRVPASRGAPHRGLDLECYVRRGASSVRVSMREVQEMTLASGHRREQMEAAFRKASEQFRKWVSSSLRDEEKIVGFRITAVPVGPAFNLGRLFGRSMPLLRPGFKLEQNGRTYEGYALRVPERDRPMVRGVRRVYADEHNHTYLEMHGDGTIAFGNRIGERLGDCRLHLAWTIGHFINVCASAIWLRNTAGVPDGEYALEVEVDVHPRQRVYLHTLGQDGSDSIGFIEDIPLVLPRLSFGPASEIDTLVSSLLTDFHDAVGHYLPTAWSLRVQNPFQNDPGNATPG